MKTPEMTGRCKEMKFIFGAAEGRGIRISAQRVYDEEGYGFVTRAAGLREGRLNIPELNSGFEPSSWLQDIEAQEISEDSHGVRAEVRAPYPAQWKIPLVFKAAVPEEGNYRITVTLSLPREAEHPQEALVFSGRRQLAFRGMLKPGETKRVTALEHAREAVRLEPENMQYRMLLERMEGGGTWYQQRQTMYGYPGSFDSSCCVKLCVANLLCNLCCGGGGLCCGGYGGSGYGGYA